MAPKTIQLDAATYEALKAYKVGGMTFAQVVQRLMEKQTPEEFHAEFLAWQRQVLANMRKSGSFTEL